MLQIVTKKEEINLNHRKLNVLNHVYKVAKGSVQHLRWSLYNLSSDAKYF